jgi:hypothetical protein
MGKSDALFDPGRKAGAVPVDDRMNPSFLVNTPYR